MNSALYATNPIVTVNFFIRTRAGGNCCNLLVRPSKGYSQERCV